MKPGAPTKHRTIFAIALIIAGGLTGCVDRVATPSKEILNLTPVTFANLPGWSHDNHADALQPFLRSCEKLPKKSSVAGSGNRFFGGIEVWREVCRNLKRRRIYDSNFAKRFFERMFRPYSVSDQISAKSDGIFTGYYEPEISGALVRYGEFQTPIYGNPSDLKKGSGPYLTRQQIESGSIKHRAQPIAWLANPIDAFFLHIQGSGRIRTPDNRVLRVGFAGHNGHPYTAIGRVLIKQGAIEREKVSMQSIRAWLSKNPSLAPAVMNQNKRYVFFRRLNSVGPIGAQGVALTPGRSLAIDPRFIRYGTPVWLDTKDPLSKAKPFQRLMVAQDTGGAIKGVVRGDIFFGHGKHAALNAGHMKQEGKYYLLLPRAAIPGS